MWKDGDTITAEKLNNMIYPIGSVYISVNNVNPSTLFGGTWEQIATGRTLVGVGKGIDSNNAEYDFNEGNNYGEYYHQLTTNEMPNNVVFSDGAEGTSWSPGRWDTYSGYTLASRGNAQSMNNIQPTFGVYIWKRTA